MSGSKRILVTGGAGFIASHVADRLVAAGHEVAVVDNLSTGKREYVPAGAQFFPYDIKSREAAELIGRWRPQVIVHHAAQMSVQASVSDPVLRRPGKHPGVPEPLPGRGPGRGREDHLRLHRRRHLRG